MEKHLQTSKFLCLVLRHAPERIGIALDANGWADVTVLLTAMGEHGHRLDKAKLDEIVATDQKKRYSYNEDETRIRANQGHSIAVDVELALAIPPARLYHGTAARFIESIQRDGLLRRNRNHVHLSADTTTAVLVGKRHGCPVVFAIDTARMYADGHVFFLSENKVWLTERVPPRYLYLLDMVPLCNDEWAH